MKFLNPYRLVIDVKNLFYEKGVFKQADFNVPVISVGNLTTGGTGKTPVVLELIELLKGKSVLVVSKSYKAQLTQPAEVTLENLKHTFMYGDEPCLIKKLAPDVKVWSGPHKTETVEFALEYYHFNKIKIDVVIVDDGFSHRSLKRHLDIVLIDVSQPMSHYKLLPFGHLREDFEQIFRSDLVILTKLNNADSETLSFFRNYLANKKQPFISSEAISLVAGENKNLFLFSGVGNSRQLKLNLEKSGYHILKHLEYPDHHQYSLSEQKNIFKQWQDQFPNSVLCATEKDRVKLSDADLCLSTKTVELKLRFSGADKDLLNAKISQIF